VNVREALFSIVSSNADVTTIIGSAPCRLYPDVIPQGAALPAAVYQGVGGAPANTLADRAPADYVRMQIWSWALDADTANALAEAFRAALEDADALLAAGVGCYCIGFIGSNYEDDTKRFGVLYDYGFWAGR
jgi:hypothetical protein